MREALLILLVIAVLLGLTAWRYRRQIATMVHIWRTFKSLRSMSGGKRDEIRPAPAAGPLVSCSKCGVWTPRDRALRLGKSTFYCSAECVEKAVEV